MDAVLATEIEVAIETEIAALGVIGIEILGGAEVLVARISTRRQSAMAVQVLQSDGRKDFSRLI